MNNRMQDYVIRSVGVPAWLVVVMILIMLSGFAMWWWESQQFKKYQRQVLESELQRLVPIREEIDSLNRQKQITKKDIQAAEERYSRLLKKLETDNVDTIDIDEAIKLLKEIYE